MLAPMQMNGLHPHSSAARHSAYVSRGELDGVDIDVLGEEYTGLWLRSDLASSHFAFTFSRNIFRQL